jgi:hypothetical protein
MAKSRINVNQVDDKSDANDALLCKIKKIKISRQIKSLTGIIKVDSPKDFDYDAELYEYFKIRYNL